MPVKPPTPEQTPAVNPDPVKAAVEPTPAPAWAADAAAPEVPAGRQPPGVYEFTGPIATQYLEVPLTARPADPGTPGRPATADEPATPEIPATPATVFDWPFSAPDDGRWQPTKRKPNQIADNAPPASEE